MDEKDNKTKAAVHGLLASAGLFREIWSAAYIGTACGNLPVLYLDITDRCNSACVACDKWKNNETGRRELSTEEITGLLPALGRLGTRLVSIGGGEPTERKDLESCVSSFSNAGIAVHINTNGLSIDKEKARALGDSGLSVAYVSMDHHTREGYKSIRGVDGLNAASEAVRLFSSLPRPISTGVNITVSRLNQNSLGEIADYAANLGAAKIQFTPIHSHLQHREMNKAELEALFPTEPERLKVSLRHITRRLRKRGIETNSTFFIEHFECAYKPVRPIPCVAGCLFVTVDAFGGVMPCYELQSGANIREMQLDEILKSDQFRKQRACVRKCATPCFDTGSAEPSIRFYPPYFLTHPFEILRQYRMHT